MGDERRINQLTAKAYDNIGSSDYFAVDNGSEAESKKLPASSIKTPISNLQGEVTGGSDTYSSTKNYSVGMYATHTTGGVQKLYRCKTACTAASWTTNASCFEEANLADAVSALNNDLSKYTFDTEVSLTKNLAWTVSRDGYVMFWCGADSGEYCYFYINDVLIASALSATGISSLPRSSIFVKKSMVIKFTGTTNAHCKFYPLK